MKEYVELRVPPKIKDYLNDSILSKAKCIGSISIIDTCIFELPSDDKQWPEILEACEKLEQAENERREKSLNEPFKPNHQKEFDKLAQLLKEDTIRRGWEVHPLHGYSWVTVKRFYTKKELHDAETLQIIPYVTSQFDRSRDDTDRIYDLDNQCSMCGIAEQKECLIFESPKFPKAKDIVRPMGFNEILISVKLARLLKESEVTGYTVKDIFKKQRSNLAIIPGWKQLIVTSEVAISDQTSFGYDCFHLDTTGKERCKVCGLTRGQGIQSLLFIKRETLSGSDIATTRERVGGGTTIGFPLQMTVISQRLYRLMIEHNIKGYHIERAYSV